MEITLDLIVFTVLAVFTLASAVLAVTTKRILRAATFLLFVLFGTAGIYFQLNYSFLGAVQLLIYAGGITVLYVFSILLTSSEGDKAEKLRGYKFVVGILATLAVPERVKKRDRPHSSILPYNGSSGGGAGQGARKQRNVVHEGCGKAMRSMESVQNKLLL